MANLLGRKCYIPRFSRVYFNDFGLFQTFRQGGSKRRVLLSLALLNAVMLLVAVVLGIKCAKVKKDSLHSSHSEGAQLMKDLDDLRDSATNMTKAAAEAKKALETAISNHTQTKTQIKLKSDINSDYQKQIATLQTEKNSLQSNLSALEGTCGKCLPGWFLRNTSCYFFSYLESAEMRKNWPDSRADCVGRGADLLVIDNQEEQEFVNDCIKSGRSSSTSWTDGVWVGLTDIETEEKWVWLNNVTELENRYWMDGEPNNHGHQGEDCAIVAYSPYSPWKTRYDGKCKDHQLAWACEMPSK